MSTVLNPSSAKGQKTWREKVGLAEMLKGGVIMDVVNVEHAKIAEDAGAVAVMALERVPADIRRDGGAELIAEVEAAAQQVFIARKFYNDLAARTSDARRRPLARIFRLAGSASPPRFFEMDDALPDDDGPG